MRSHHLTERGRADELGARARRRADRHRNIAQIARVRRRAASCRRRPTAAHGSVGRSVPTICAARWPSSMRWSGCGALAVLQWLLLENLATQSPGDPSLPRRPTTTSRDLSHDRDRRQGCKRADTRRRALHARASLARLSPRPRLTAFLSFFTITHLRHLHKSTVCLLVAGQGLARVVACLGPESQVKSSQILEALR